MYRSRNHFDPICEYPAILFVGCRGRPDGAIHFTEKGRQFAPEPGSIFATQERVMKTSRHDFDLPGDLSAAIDGRGHRWLPPHLIILSASRWILACSLATSIAEILPAWKDVMAFAMRFFEATLKLRR
jgi:hypothetical protein